jgi:DNA mismatch endonuclease, patch repair protein
MTDTVDGATRSRMMAGIRSSNTQPELFLRSALHAEGLRYRLGGCGLPGKPDLVFPGRSTVIFVHGCFWHRHNCAAFRWPQSNRDFWFDKLTTNARRDKLQQRRLRQLGWSVLTVWECQLRKTGYTLPNKTVESVLLKLNKA